MLKIDTCTHLCDNINKSHSILFKYSETNRYVSIIKQVSCQFLSQCNLPVVACAVLFRTIALIPPYRGSRGSQSQAEAREMVTVFGDRMKCLA